MLGMWNLSQIFFQILFKKSESAFSSKCLHCTVSLSRLFTILSTDSMRAGRITSQLSRHCCRYTVRLCTNYVWYNDHTEFFNMKLYFVGLLEVALSELCKMFLVHLRNKTSWKSCVHQKIKIRFKKKKKRPGRINTWQNHLFCVWNHP